MKKYYLKKEYIGGKKIMSDDSTTTSTPYENINYIKTTNDQLNNLTSLSYYLNELDICNFNNYAEAKLKIEKENYDRLKKHYKC